MSDQCAGGLREWSGGTEAGPVRVRPLPPPRQIRYASPMTNWEDCPLVQRDPRFVSGQPALRSHPRVLVEPLVESAELGMK